LVARSERGRAKVICFSPRHDLTLARMEKSDIRKVVDAWAEQYLELGKLPYIGHVQIFENRGAMMVASNTHPHGQISAEEFIPTISFTPISIRRCSGRPPSANSWSDTSFWGTPSAMLPPNPAPKNCAACLKNTFPCGRNIFKGKKERPV